VPLLNAQPFIVWTLKTGTRIQFSLSLQSQAFLTATGLPRSRQYASWISCIKRKKHMEFHEYTEVIWTAGEKSALGILPGW